MNKNTPPALNMFLLTDLSCFVIKTNIGNGWRVVVRVEHDRSARKGQSQIKDEVEEEGGSDSVEKQRIGHFGTVSVSSGAGDSQKWSQLCWLSAVPGKLIRTEVELM